MFAFLNSGIFKIFMNKFVVFGIVVSMFLFKIYLLNNHIEDLNSKVQNKDVKIEKLETQINLLNKSLLVAQEQISISQEKCIKEKKYLSKLYKTPKVQNKKEIKFESIKKVEDINLTKEDGVPFFFDKIGF